MSSALVFIFVLGVLVVVHEFGHFIAARAVGVRVEKFSIGFGPVIFGKQFGETEFCVSLLPLGGFVKLSGESPEESEGHPWEFNSKNLWEKFLVVAAGPCMNAFLAFVIFSSIYLVGQPTLSNKIGKVLEGAPAQSAGLLENDRVLSINGRAVTYWEDILKELHKNPDKTVFTIERASKKLDRVVIPKKQVTKTIFGKQIEVSFVGIAPSNEMSYVKSGPFQAVRMGAARVWQLTSMILYSLGLMFTGAMPFKDSMTGPIGIFFMTKEAAQMGALYLFYFMGSLSVSLFVLNILPIPVLDGGHVLFILIERIKGSPIKNSIKERLTQGGMALLLLLMAFVILQDIHRFAIVDNVMHLFKRG
ncbi:MAG: RIP metalloprotease RseP [Candidatus Omnitrophica bacterium CG07_land_8_20_14_0_80_50_8]|nr:MAG: RIP metalloprotease RseP [Candidatus Omnitrophica bacterium CG1_02_49_16]PIU40551.1 MAG: RIP metalloprotease RseP [Candidatus Omnitrophica bacterium CG07_land_8_20_14_0_80_50_8]